MAVQKSKVSHRRITNRLLFSFSSFKGRGYKHFNFMLIKKFKDFNYENFFSDESRKNLSVTIMKKTIIENKSLKSYSLYKFRDYM